MVCYCAVDLVGRICGCPVDLRSMIEEKLCSISASSRWAEKLLMLQPVSMCYESSNWRHLSGHSPRREQGENDIGHRCRNDTNREG